MQRTFNFQVGGRWIAVKFGIFCFTKHWNTRRRQRGWDALETKRYKAEGKRSNGNKGDETEEGAKVNGAAYRWKADHKEGATAWQMEMILRNGWETGKGQVMDRKRKTRNERQSECLRTGHQEIDGAAMWRTRRRPVGKMQDKTRAEQYFDGRRSKRQREYKDKSKGFCFFLLIDQIKIHPKTSK